MRPLHCDRSRAWISLDLDGSLSEFEAIKLRRHLGRCAQCRSFAADAAALTHLLRSTPLEVPESHVELPGRIPARRRGAAALALATAAAGLAAALAVHSGSGGAERQSAPSAAPAGRPAALALISYDAANLGVRRSVPRIGAGGGDLVRGTSQLPAF